MINALDNARSTKIVACLLFVSVLYTLSGMFYMPTINSYKTFFYILCLLPSIIILLSGGWSPLRRNYYLLLLFLYLEWLALSILWSDTDHSYIRYVKYTGYILVFSFVNILLYHLDKKTYDKAYFYAAIIVAVAAVYNIYGLINDGLFLSRYRFVDNNILFNPLYVGSAYGYFFIYAFSMGYLRKINPVISALLCLPVMFILIQTNTRTPLLAIAVSTFFLVSFSSNKLKVSLYRSLILLLMVGGLFYLYSDYFLQRGSSHRIEVWTSSIQYILDKPIFGHGLENTLIIWVPGLSFALSDTHNIFLEIVYYSGLIGLCLFIVFLGTLFYQSIKLRHKPEVIVASTLVVYGLSSGLTEGAGILSRPGVFWFKLWLPISFLLAVISANKFPMNFTNKESKPHV